MSKAQAQQAAAMAIAQVTKSLMEEIAATPETKNDGKHDMVNESGDILRAHLTLGQRENAPNPLSVVVNEEIFWIPRGVEVVVPWYVVAHMKNNIETRYRKEKDKDTGKNVVIAYQTPAEPFSYSAIDPAKGQKRL